MSYAQLSAEGVYAACTEALRTKYPSENPENEKFRIRVGAIADLSHYVWRMYQANGQITLSPEDFALINGFMPSQAGFRHS